MSPKHLGLTALAAIGLTLASWYWLDEREAARAEEAQARAQAETAQRNAGLNTGLADLFRPLPASEAQAAAAKGQQVWLAAGQGGSPGSVPGMPPPDIQAETPQQRAEMEALRKLGYHIEQRYYQMSLAELRQAADGGDRQALTHLAER
ncbi:MAG TPA: hypothetical protein VK195_05425, partial [Burkholderiaceae bacterium]|nr:hypothetical protein [Burkholderiaceae bacterium]